MNTIQIPPKYTKDKNFRVQAIYLRIGFTVPAYARDHKNDEPISAQEQNTSDKESKVISQSMFTDSPYMYSGIAIVLHKSLAKIYAPTQVLYRRIKLGKYYG